MEYKPLNHIVYGGDYNPDQWMETPEIWDEDMRLMKLAHINSATVGIFSWAVLEPEEGVYNFGWLDEIMDKCAANGIGVVLATPSGARPAWLAQKYPEVLQVPESGIRNEYGVRHNHCYNSEIYREKVRNINRLLAQRYKDHPALIMWHISNEYGGECHCETCQHKFREYLKNYFEGDLARLNREWWTGFWAHTVTDWSQLNTPKNRGENHVPSQKTAFRRFVSDCHMDFFKNEIEPLREFTPNIPITTNFMGLFDGIDYSKFSKLVDITSWDNYPFWENEDNVEVATRSAFTYDLYRSFKYGMPFYLMESTPSITNWHPINKIPRAERSEQSSVQAVAYGADSVQYFQWRKGRNGHEKYHGAVVDHVGNENTRVFRSVTHIGEVLEKLSDVAGARSTAKVAIIYDWENKWAVKGYCGYNNVHRDYNEECIKWYKPFYDRGITCDVIAQTDDFTKYDVVIAPYLYLLADGTEDRISEYIKNGGVFVSTYLFATVDREDRVFFGGLPGGKLKDVFGIWAEETDSIPEYLTHIASFEGKDYPVNHICDIIHSNGADVLGEYKTDFYAGSPSVTVNKYGDGFAYYTAFRNDGDFAEDFCKRLIEKHNIEKSVDFDFTTGLTVRRRGDFIFLINFLNQDCEAELDKEYTDVLTGEKVSGKIIIPEYGYRVIK